MSPECIEKEYKSLNSTVAALGELMSAARESGDYQKRSEMIMGVSRNLQELSRRSRELSNLTRNRSRQLRESLNTGL